MPRPPQTAEKATTGRWLSAWAYLSARNPSAATATSGPAVTVRTGIALLTAGMNSVAGRPRMRTPANATTGSRNAAVSTLTPSVRIIPPRGANSATQAPRNETPAPARWRLRSHSRSVFFTRVLTGSPGWPVTRR